MRWYWRKDELASLARSRGVGTGGDKATLTERLVAHLDGTSFAEPPTRRAGTAQLREPLDASTVIPAGQRCSQVVRAWLTAQLGTPYRFDAAMRDFFTRADGTTTLGDALAHHRSTRDAVPGEIGEQFELNRFSRTWRRRHPTTTRDQLLRAWHVHRDLPAEERLRWFATEAEPSEPADGAGTSGSSTTSGS